MSGYTSLIEEIEKLRRNVAVFRKVVLHSHSTESPDYGKSIKTTGSKEKYINTEEEYEKALGKSKLHMVAITDHMKCGLACRISESKPSGEICILPGMEINFRLPPPLHTSKLHLLVIFPEKCSHEQICKILPAEMPDEKNRNGLEEIKGDIRDFVEKVHECGGLCIAAHIDSNRGIRKTFRQLGRDGIVFYSEGKTLTPKEEKKISDQFKDWLLLSGIDAIEVAKYVDKKHYSWISEEKGRRTTVAVLLKGDIHRVEEQAGEELAEKAKSLQRATLVNSIIRILYLDKEGQTHILETTFDPKQDCTTRFYDAQGEEREIYDVEASYPLRLFGWSEIETLGREAHRQRDLLDRLIPDFSELIGKRYALRAALEKKRDRIISN
jgi:PHP family Zn ribbon phosphoesterase